MSCNNDWDSLKEVIVGVADFANIPVFNKSFWKCQFPEYEESYIKKYTGFFPKQIIEEQNEDLDTLSKTLESLGIIVYRPDIRHAEKEIVSPTWKGKNWHYHCPRDLTLIVGKNIIETPSPIWNRQFETWGYRDIFFKLFKEGYNWIKSPIPLLEDENYKDDTVGVPSLNNTEILFEAANCVRVNNDILYQVSNTGNSLGAEWLQRILGDEYVIHKAENLYSYAHLDSTIIPLREGLVLYNASRVTEENEPEMFKSWDKIWVDEAETIDNKHNMPWGASEWVGINMLSINQNLAIVDRKQTKLHKKLKEHKIEVIPLELRHDRIMSGGFHCVTLDLKREQ